jgi:predicted CXXCH cytochrome family protein
LALWAAGGAGALLLGSLFLVALAVKERDNRFCVSCHLHDEKFERLVAATPTDLSGQHHRQDATVGCIACHGGATLERLAIVWTVAGFDTLKFLAGAYREPRDMRLPLPDLECRQCHSPIIRTASDRPAPGPRAIDPTDDFTFAAEAATEGRGGGSYHAIREHDTVPVRCVSCHASHTTDSDAANRFVSKAAVAPICRECHKEM